MQPTARPRALSATRRPSRDASGQSATTPTSARASEGDMESGSVYYDALLHDVFPATLEDEQDSDTGSGIDELHPQSPHHSAASRERIAAKQWWFDLQFEFRTHVNYLQHVTQDRPELFAKGREVAVTTSGLAPHDNAVTAKPVPNGTGPISKALGNDITNEDTFLSLATGYHAYLCRIRRWHPEAMLPIWHATRSLGGRWTAARRATVRDEGFLITVPPTGDPERTRIDLTQEANCRAFRQLLATRKRPGDATLRALVLPDLSPLFIELVGGLLRVDHRVFTNHMWTQHSRPFHARNRYELDGRADTSDPDTAFTLDVDGNAVTYIRSGAPAVRERARLRHLLQFFRPSPTYTPFLDRRYYLWPASLTAVPDTASVATSFHATSRATVHWIENSASPVQALILLTPSSDAFTGEPAEHMYQSFGHTVYSRDDDTSFKYNPRASAEHLAEPGPQSTSDRYCADMERLLVSARVPGGADLKSICLQYLTEKFLDSTHAHILLDTRRLTTFRIVLERSSRHENRLVSTGPDDEEAYDPLRDLQYLRDRVASRQSHAHRLADRVHSALAEQTAGHAAAGQDPRQSGRLTQLHFQLRQLLQQLERLQESITAAQAESSASLQRRLTLLQLEEARKSIAQGAMVRKLTVLAFVFVPISATASAFGMNLAPLLSNPPPAWSFAVAAAGLTVLLIALASADAAASVVRGLQAASASSATTSVSVPAGATTAHTTANPLKVVAHKTLSWTIAGAALILHLVVIAVEPFTLAYRVLAHVHEQGAAIRARERSQVDGLFKARLAYRESPVGMWWTACRAAWMDRSLWWLFSWDGTSARPNAVGSGFGTGMTVPVGKDL